MRRTNQNLLIAFVGLLVVNLVIAFTPKNTKKVSFDENRFAIEEISEIQRVSIGELSLTKNGEVWLVNNQYPADPNLIQLLISIMQRVAVKKPVNEYYGETLEVKINDEVAFSVSSNPTKTKTYFVAGEERFEVHIPGYNEFLGGIFELAPDQWRDRLLLDASWRTIQELNLNYTDESRRELSISFDENFFTVKDVAQLDSNSVVEYLNQFQVFQVNEWVSEGRFARYDSLAQTSPLANLTISTINSEEPIAIDIFPQYADERFYLARVNDGALMVIDEKRMGSILKSSSDFRLSD
ncbi:MAG: hypothetical protein JXR10_10675 [Cyclobacteriaceae bacterium]